MKRLLSVVLMAMLCIACLSCAAMAEEKKLIGFINGVPETPFFSVVEKGLKECCEERGWDLMIGYGVNEKVLEHGRMFITQGVDAIVNFGVTTDTGVTLVEEAADAKIPVIDVDVDCGGYYFGANNEQAGAVLGDALARYIKGIEGYEDMSMKAVMFWTGREGDDVRKRLTGIVKGLNEQGITNISEDNNYENDTIVWQIIADESQTKEYTKNQLSALADSTDLIILMGISDYYGPFMCAAIDECGLDSSRVLVVTHNESETVAENLKDENSPWIASTAYLPQEYGSYITGMLEKLFNGEELAQRTLMEHVAITRENVNDFYPGTI